MLIVSTSEMTAAASASTRSQATASDATATVDVEHRKDLLKKFLVQLRDGDMAVSLCIDPDLEQVRAAHRIDAAGVLLDCGKYSEARGADRKLELQRLTDAARSAAKLGMRVSAGGGLGYQTVAPLEAVVVDGCSTDGTWELLQELARTRPWLRPVRNPDKNTPAALNIGFAEARGSIVARMDTHARYPADYIETALRTFEEHPEAWAVGSAMACFDEARQYALKRVQFGKPIGSFQLTQRKLAIMLTELTKAQLVAYRLAQLKDAGRVTPQQISMAKRSNVNTAIEVARAARDILGGVGILDEYQCFRHMNNLESVKTYEGTDDMHLLILGEKITGMQAFA